MSEAQQALFLELTAEMATAWLSNPQNKISGDDLPSALRTIHDALVMLASPQAEPEPQYQPAVSVRRSLASRDHIISMIDGKPYQMLKRHLGLNGLTPDEYRERYGLRPDYPMVAEAYAERRRSLAKKIGLGRKPGQKMKGQPIDAGNYAQANTGDDTA